MRGAYSRYKLSPILYDTLVHLELMPYREFATPKDLKAALHGVDRLLIDATERSYHRSTDDTKQREHYSGKKRHTLKNTVMSLPDKFIVFLGRTFSGHNHDYSMLKQEFPPELDWFTAIHVRADLWVDPINEIEIAQRFIPRLHHHQDNLSSHLHRLQHPASYLVRNDKLPNARPSS